MRVLSATYSSQCQFIAAHVAGKNILEVGSSGYTEFVMHLRDCHRAKGVLSIDVRPLRYEQCSSVYLQANVDYLHCRRNEIASKFCGALPDTILCTSVFGALNINSTRNWFSEFAKIAAPGGSAFFDFLLYRADGNLPSFKSPKAMTKEEFNQTLDEFKLNTRVAWKPASVRNCVQYEHADMMPRPPRRPPSITYQMDF